MLHHRHQLPAPADPVGLGARHHHRERARPRFPGLRIVDRRLGQRPGLWPVAVGGHRLAVLNRHLIALGGVVVVVVLGRQSEQRADAVTPREGAAARVLLRTALGDDHRPVVLQERLAVIDAGAHALALLMGDDVLREEEAVFAQCRAHRRQHLVERRVLEGIGAAHLLGATRHGELGLRLRKLGEKVLGHQCAPSLIVSAPARLRVTRTPCPKAFATSSSTMPFSAFAASALVLAASRVTSQPWAKVAHSFEPCMLTWRTAGTGTLAAGMAQGGCRLSTRCQNQSMRDHTSPSYSSSQPTSYSLGSSPPCTTKSAARRAWVQARCTTSWPG